MRLNTSETAEGVRWLPLRPARRSTILRSICYYAASATLAAQILACDGARETRHPIYHQVSKSHAISDTAALGTAALLQHAHVIWRTGSMNGDDAPAFGNVMAAAIDSLGNVLVLDNQANNVSVLDAAGRLVTRFGNAGAGPGEFRHPTALMIAGRKVRVAVRSGFVEYDSVPPRRDAARNVLMRDMGVASDMCMSGEKIVRRVAGGFEEGAVAVLSEDGRTSRYGEVYTRGSWLTNSQLSEGYVECDAELVYTAFRYLPIIAAYGHDGVLQWRVELPDFAPLTFIESTVSGSRPTFRTVLSNPGDLVLTLVAVPGSGVLAQVAHLKGATKDRPGVQVIASTDSYFISRSGSPWYLGRHLPPILAADDHRLIGTALDTTKLYPQVVALEYGR